MLWPTNKVFRKKKPNPPKGSGSLDPRVPGGPEGHYRAVPRAAGRDRRVPRGGRPCPQEDGGVVPVAREARLKKKRLTISFQNSHPPLCPPLLENSTATLLTPPASSPSPPFSLFRPPPGARRLDPAGPPAPARDDSPRLRRAARRRRLDRGRAPHFGRDVPAGRGQQDDRVGRGGRAGAVRAGYPVGEDQALR